jgi:hypothetical protein
MKTKRLLSYIINFQCAPSKCYFIDNHIPLEKLNLYKKNKYKCSPKDKKQTVNQMKIKRFNLERPFLASSVLIKFRIFNKLFLLDGVEDFNKLFRVLSCHTISRSFVTWSKVGSDVYISHISKWNVLYLFMNKYIRICVCVCRMYIYFLLSTNI